MTDTQQFLQIAVRQINVGNPAAAIAPLHRVLAADPHHPIAHAHLAHCLRDTGRAAEAQREIATTLALSPEDGYTRRIAGIIAIDGGDLAAGEDHLNAARRLSHWDPWVYRWLARLYCHTGRSDMAVWIIDDGLQQVPNDAGLTGAKASLLLDAGDTAGAARAAAEALRLDPESANAHSVLGVIRLFDGDTDQAREHALLALRSNPNHLPANWLHRLIRLKRNPFFGLCWFVAKWMHRATQGGSNAAVKYALVFVLVAATSIARWIDPNWGTAFSASLVVLLFGTAIGMKLLVQAALRKIAAVRLSSDF